MISTRKVKVSLLNHQVEYYANGDKCSNVTFSCIFSTLPLAIGIYLQTLALSQQSSLPCTNRVLSTLRHINGQVDLEEATLQFSLQDKFKVSDSSLSLSNTTVF